MAKVDLKSVTYKEDKLDIDKTIEEWKKESKSVKVFVTGKTGTGKSTLVNGVVGEHVAIEGDTLDPETMKVKMNVCSIGDVTVHIWDSPGLQDGTKFEEEYKKDIQDNCKDMDLYLYCVNMSQTRFVRGGPDVKAMCELTQILGPEMWKNTLFIMTFANDVIAMAEDKGLSGVELHEHFIKKVKLWTDKIHKCLCEEVGLSKEIADGVVTVPAGHYNVPQLIDKGDYWLTKLWLQALSKAKSKAQPALIKVNEHRFKTIDEVDHKKMFKELLYKQPLIFQEKVGEIERDLGLSGSARILSFLKGVKKIGMRLLFGVKIKNGEFDLHVAEGQ